MGKVVSTTIVVLALLMITAAGATFIVYEAHNTRSELSEVREELHILRVGISLLRPDTVRWSISTYDRLMNFIEREAEEGRWRYGDDEGLTAEFSLLRYIVDASLEGFILPEEAAPRVDRMEDYLGDQPGPDESNEQELEEIRTKIR